MRQSNGPEPAVPVERSDDEFALVAKVARAYEVDRYLSALLAPASVRTDLIALAAFAGEIARIPVMVAEPMMGEMRLQWWRDALLAGRAGVRSGHPVADQFSAVARAHDLPESLIERVIDAQRPVVYSDPPADVHALKAHLAGSEGSLFQLAARMLDRQGAIDATTVLDRGGVSYGLARLVLEFSVVLSQGRTLAPVQLQQAAGFRPGGRSPEDVTAAATVLEQLCGLAEDELRGVVERASRDRRVRLALLPLAMVPAYVRRVRALGRRAIVEPVDVAPLFRVWRLWRARYGWF